MSEGVFFLDFDGPFYPNKSFLLKENKGDYCDKICRDLDLYPKIHYWKMDPMAVAMMNNIHTDLYPFEIVISSSWSHPLLHEKEHIQNLLDANQMIGKMHSNWRTDKNPAKRVEQIANWLSLNPKDKYIILDDAESGYEMLDKRVLKSFNINPEFVFMVDMDNGISMEQYQGICAIVNTWKV